MAAVVAVAPDIHSDNLLDDALVIRCLPSPVCLPFFLPVYPEMISQMNYWHSALSQVLPLGKSQLRQLFWMGIEEPIKTLVFSLQHGEGAPGFILQNQSCVSSHK